PGELRVPVAHGDYDRHVGRRRPPGDARGRLHADRTGGGPRLTRRHRLTSGPRLTRGLRRVRAATTAGLAADGEVRVRDARVEQPPCQPPGTSPGRYRRTREPG